MRSGNLFSRISLNSTAWFYLLLFIFFTCVPSPSLGHDLTPHLDPELLAGRLTWLHLTIQWIHLVTFAAWIGLTAGILLLGITPRLDQLLYSTWILFLLALATGSYNMEWSAGISQTPSLLSLPLLERIPYGVTYTVVLNAKLGFYALAVLVALVITFVHVSRKADEIKLRRIFLLSETTIAIIISLLTAVVLFYHEAADLWPTAIHSMGGVAGPQTAESRSTINEGLSPPNDFQLLTTTGAWVDIGVRWIHLLGFGLLFGTSMVASVFQGVSPGRFLLVTWVILGLQLFSGIVNMKRWSPFYMAPYIWNLHDLSHLRFGHTYTLFMATKHVLIAVIVSLVAAWTFRNSRLISKGNSRPYFICPLARLVFLLGLVIAYIMMIVLFLHEGIDHAL